MVTSLAEVWIEIPLPPVAPPGVPVTSLAEVWIEISICYTSLHFLLVTSLAEVWIEMQSQVETVLGPMASLPLRKCGLK